jgi:predicted component of type VI protein secretion system
MTDPAPNPAATNHPAVENLTEAHRLLNGLRERLDRHPELEQAIEKLEMALSQLTVKTGGML